MAQQTILIVEDEKFIRIAYQDKLEQAGYRIVLAANGEEGLAQARKEMPDLIILDLNMPVMDGNAMLAKLRETSWGKDIPAIVMTNSGDSSDVLDSLKGKAQTYFIKAEVSLEKLEAEVKRLVSTAS